MNITNLTEDDMCDLIKFFRIPTKLYEQISKYADSKNIKIKSAMAQLLSLTHNILSTSTQYLYYKDDYFDNYIDITEN